MSLRSALVELPDRTYTAWEYQVIQLPASTYRLPHEPKDCEPHTATDLLNTWGELGWQLMGVLGPYEVILMRPKQEPV